MEEGSNLRSYLSNTTLTVPPICPLSRFLLESMKPKLHLWYPPCVSFICLALQIYGKDLLFPFFFEIFFFFFCCRLRKMCTLPYLPLKRCARRTRTSDLKGMSLASYQLLHRTMFVFFVSALQIYGKDFEIPNFRKTFFFC